MNNIIQKLNDLGYHTIDKSWYTYVANWDSWYKGNVADFHNFKVYNGQRHIDCKRYTLGMAKKICEDWANLLMNEKVQITLEGEREQAFIDGIFAASDFEANMNELQERAAARGTYAIIPRVRGAETDSDGKIIRGGGASIALDYITAERIFPLSWSGRKIVECAFAKTIIGQQDKYLYLQIHRLENGKYIVENHAYKMGLSGVGAGEEAPFEDVPGLENAPKTINTDSDKPWFVIGRYNIANNIDDDNPMGISVYANALDVLKAVDIAYDSYVNEFALGKKRVMVKPAATKTLDGESVFDENDVTFYVLPEDIGDGTIIQPIDMTLRTGEHSQGLQEQLNQLSGKCGFGQQHYKFDQGDVSTATQIISENSDMFRTIKKHELILKSVLVELCRILLRMGNTYMNAGLNEDIEISVDFDDSIIENKEVDFNRTLTLLNAGLMKPEEARSILMNEDIETARKALPGMEDLTAGETEDEVE